MLLYTINVSLSEICLEILDAAAAHQGATGVWKRLRTMNESTRTPHQTQLLIMPPATIT